MKIQIDDNQNLLNIFVSLIALLLFGLMIYVSHSIISPIFVYGLIVFYFLNNRANKTTRNVFYLSTVIFILWFVNELFSILIPFLFALLFAYILNPLVKFLVKKNFSQLLATILTMIVLLLFFGFLVAVILPPFIEQISLLITTASDSISKLQSYFSNSVLPNLEKFGIVYPDLVKFISSELPLKLQDLVNGLLKNILSIISSIGVIFNQVINLIIIPIITFYFLKDFDKVKNAFLNLFRADAKQKIEKIGKKIDSIFGNYIRGFFFIALINGIVITTGLILLKVKYALVLGLISALLCVIPYFGIIIAFATGFIISLVSGIDSWKLILIPILYFGENLIENSIYIPKIIGSKVGLHPLIILFSIFVFGYFGGIFGMLLAVPVTALLISLVFEKYKT